MDDYGMFTNDEVADEWVNQDQRACNNDTSQVNNSNELSTHFEGAWDQDEDVDDHGIEEEPIVGDDELHSLVGTDDEENTRFVAFNDRTGMKAPDLKTGMTYRNHKVFRDALKEWCIQKGFNYQYVHNDRKNITVKCKNLETCNFYVHASKILEDGTMQIKTFRPTHQCSKEEVNHLVDSRYLCDKYIDDLRDNIEISNDAFVKKATRELSSKVSRFQVYRTKKKAEVIVQGDHKEQYKFMRDLCNMILSTNEGSTACVKVDVVPPMMIDGVQQKERYRFERMYVCFNAFKVGFLAGCRPFIGLDGCHLKGPMGGHILAAIGLDGNDNMYPIAIAVVEAETKDSWAWFIDLLHRDIGHTRDKNWTWISDKQKGLVEVFSEEMSFVEHRFCLRHLYENFKKEFKGKEYKDAFWMAANANTPKEWKRRMENIKKMDNGKAYAWLMKLNPATWIRSHMCIHSKCDLLVNNVCESFNEYIKDARDKPIISMWNWIRKNLMRRMVAKEEAMKKYIGPICPNIQIKLEQNKNDSREFIAIEAGNLKYEVEGPGSTKIVDLAARSCSCREWDLNGIPSYKVKMVLIPGMDEWESIGLNPVDAPIIRKPPGRPRKARKKASDEPKHPYNLSRRNKPVKCGNCHQEGHNSGGCRAAVTGETIWQRRVRKQVEKRASNTEQVSNIMQPQSSLIELEGVSVMRPRHVPAAISNRERSSLDGGKGNTGANIVESLTQPPWWP